MAAQDRMERVRQCMEGLSVGDALGERYALDPGFLASARDYPMWPFTDDTQMALSVTAILHRHGRIDQDLLARSFSERYQEWRGYGAAMHGLLARIGRNEHWVEASRSLFSGQGSFGNGAAMRVGPVGAYFADDLVQLAEQAALSAEVTHAHPEGIAGAIAVAAAVAWAWRLRGYAPLPEVSDFLRLVLPSVPLSTVRRKLQEACDLGNAPLDDAVRLLGNGAGISAQDTVPFALWCAGRHLSDYEAALLFTAGALGDCDTNCAIVGGIVVMLTGPEAIPPAWLSAREPLPSWPWK